MSGGARTGFTAKMTGILSGLLIAYLGLVGIVYLTQRSLMYHPGATRGDPGSFGVPEMGAVQVDSSDGLRIESWFAAPGDGKPTLVFFQGNAGAIADRGFKVRPYLDHGYGVVLAGYRGYGGNPGRPTEDGLYADAAAVLANLAAEGVPPADWVLYGESLGTGVAVEMARRQADAGAPVGVVVLEAPFDAMGNAAAAHYPYLPARLLVRDKYDSLTKIAEIDSPLFVFHGDRDRVVPQRLGRSLFDAAREPKQALWIDGAHHGDLYDFGAAAEVIAFVDAVRTMR